tara:strand:+ start:386 stop:1159 length:774 start_codon:yes stop_codon:yes gene_type:complete
MGVNVTTPVYEGPFDLLLDLILREEVELYEVSLLTIVDAYLEELQNMQEYDLELATEFLLIAAILVELKARRLLPSGNNIDPDDEFGLWEERDLLLAKLVECKTFKEAASQLREMSQQASLSWPRRAGLEDAFLSLTPDLLEGVTKEDLREACLRAMAPRPSMAVNTDYIAPIKATVVEAVKELLEDVPKTGLISFRELTKGLTDRIEIVVKFLAILELYKQGVLEIDQIDSFGEISVSWCPGAELSDMDLLDIYEG